MVAKVNTSAAHITRGTQCQTDLDIREKAEIIRDAGIR